MNPPLTFRLAMIEERVALEDLQFRASLENANDRDALLAQPDAVEIPDSQLHSGQVRVCLDSGAVVGFSVVVPGIDDEFELDGLFVEPRLQGRGLGRALLTDACHHARSSGAKSLLVVANPHALRFYEACGFLIVGRATTRFGPALLMRKPL
jgi:ribosomal protein S18 acetylase RimI-like enzyme